MPVILSLAFALLAQAHEGEPLAPHDLWTAWTNDPIILAGMSLSALLFWRGRTRASSTWFYAAGWTALFLALVSPVHPAGEALFSAHMIQHEILMLVASPLLVLARPLIPYLRALPPDLRMRAVGLSRQTWFRNGWRWLSSPIPAFTIHAAALWIWHIPQLFDATLTSELVHFLQHASFLGTALLFWWSLIFGHRAASGYGTAVILMFATLIHSGALGALLTLSPVCWYEGYLNSTAVWGLTPLEDQQIGGLIMWIPASLVYLGAGLLFLALWLRRSDLDRNPARANGVLSTELPAIPTGSPTVTE